MGFEGPSMFVDFTAQAAGRELVWEVCKRNYFDARHPHLLARRGGTGVGLVRLRRLPVRRQAPSRRSATSTRSSTRGPSGTGRRAAGQDDVVNLIRCAWAGSQRYGALVWSGDISSTWTDLRRQVVAGIQMGLAGIPWFTTDIGGFHDGDPDDPAFRELLIRWFQYGTFSPVMRLHGDRLPSTPVAAADGSHRSPTGGANEIWSFGPAAEEILADHLRLRERLRPYLRHVMEAGASRRTARRARALPRVPGGSRRVGPSSESFLLGSALLVAPVLEAGVTAIDVHLPAGARWRESATGIEHDGGGRVTAAAPLDTIPTFVRIGHPDAVLLGGLVGNHL